MQMRRVRGQLKAIRVQLSRAWLDYNKEVMDDAEGVLISKKERRLAYMCYDYGEYWEYYEPYRVQELIKKQGEIMSKYGIEERFMFKCKTIRRKMYRKYREHYLSYRSK